jgi:hypothetical protein
VTRPFNQQFHCSNCNTWQTQETLFGRWIRNNPSLESRSGYCVVDQDYWVHRFKTYAGKEFQCLMLVEIKTMGADLTPAQTDTLHIINQFLRNRRQTPTKELRFQAGNFVNAYSTMNGRRVQVRAYGMHVLRFSGLGPQDSEWITWDRSEIDVDTLTKVLRFDLDPDDISKPLDLRSHHASATARNLDLPLTGE